MQVKFDVGREALKWIAIATMTVDHVGAIFYPNYVVLRIIGRISFPLFSYLTALGIDTTRKVKNTSSDSYFLGSCPKFRLFWQ